jgi:hypothetical protein
MCSAIEYVCDGQPVRIDFTSDGAELPIRGRGGFVDFERAAMAEDLVPYRTGRPTDAERERLERDIGNLIARLRRTHTGERVASLTFSAKGPTVRVTIETLSMPGTDARRIPGRAEPRGGTIREGRATL